MENKPAWQFVCDIKGRRKFHEETNESITCEVLFSGALDTLAVYASVDEAHRIHLGMATFQSESFRRFCLFALRLPSAELLQRFSTATRLDTWRKRLCDKRAQVLFFQTATSQLLHTTAVLYKQDISFAFLSSDLVVGHSVVNAFSLNIIEQLRKTNVDIAWKKYNSVLKEDFVLFQVDLRFWGRLRTYAACTSLLLYEIVVA